MLFNFVLSTFVGSSVTDESFVDEYTKFSPGIYDEFIYVGFFLK